jgi:anaerobic magnesium-protoporphyrin IX monomethyl ester cyclase
MEEKINLCLVNMPAQWISSEQYEQQDRRLLDIPFGLPLGLLLLSSHVKQNARRIGEVWCLDYQTAMLEPHQYETVDDFIDLVARQCSSVRPHVIGISVMFSTAHYFSVRVAHVFKRLWPEAVVIFGGNHASNCPDILLQEACVDYVCCGEGEEVLREFIDVFDDPARRALVRGMRSRGDAKVKEFAELLPDLDAIPMPDWDLLDMEAYIRQATRMRRFDYDADEGMVKRAAILMSSRGCPFHCTFCASHTVHGRSMRYRSPENVLAEMRELNRRYDINVFAFEDDMFVVQREQARSMLREFIKLRQELPGFELIFPNALNVNTMTEDILSLMRDAGMRIAQIAIESGSDYTQTHIVKKRIKIDKAVELVRYARELGLIARVGFIIGFPDETRALVDETIAYIRNLDADWTNINIATPLIGSEMYEQFKERGRLADIKVMWGADFDQTRRDREHTGMKARDFDTEEFSSEELRDIQYRTNLEVNFLRNVNLREGRWERAELLFRSIANEYPFHIFSWWGRMVALSNLGNPAAARAMAASLRGLLISDEKARHMHELYGTLLPDLAAQIALVEGGQRLDYRPPVSAFPAPGTANAGPSAAMLFEPDTRIGMKNSKFSDIP